MPQETLEQRVETLERELADLKVAVANGKAKKDWRRTIGMFTGDKVMKEIFDEALKFREADRQKARRQFAKTRASKAPAKAKK
jgi:hypothetical protein